MARHAQTAPSELIVRDFHRMDGEINLGATYELERALLMIAVASHAHSGHGAFRGRQFVDTTEDHVARALGLDPRREQKLRQSWIDGVRDYALAAARGMAPPYAVNDREQPLIGIGILRWIKVDPREVLIGLLLGGHRDSPQFRRLAQAKYGIAIGYGRAHPVSVHRMLEEGLNARELASRSHEPQLDEYMEKGIILPDFTEVGGDVQNLYVRYQIGPGASDDAAVLAAGKLYGIGAAVGCYLADAIDTLEKYTANPTDADEEISALIEAEAPDLGVTRDQIVHLTYLASTPPDMDGILPDSTMRHFLRRDAATDQSILESHLLYLLGHPWTRMQMGRDPLMDNAELYRYVEDRIKSQPLPA